MKNLLKECGLKETAAPDAVRAGIHCGPGVIRRVTPQSYKKSRPIFIL
jgi:hypothetical protein